MKTFFALSLSILNLAFAGGVLAAPLYGEALDKGKGEIVEVTVTEVCPKKGCWMKVKNGEKETFVRFKDYGFFVPTDLAGKKIRMKAVSVSKDVSVKEQQHFLEDAKAPLEQIKAVKTPQKRQEYLASGVEVLP